MTKKIAIVGAGASGLASIKCCLDEGLEPICFEREADIGGLWNYSEDPKQGKGSVYKSCVINTSKEMMAFSDFPVPADYPPFMPHSYVLKYLRAYADKFDLCRYIEFGVSIEDVSRADDYAETGRWLLSLRRSEDTQDDAVLQMTVDGVMVCSGHHVFPHIPEFTGMADFKGVKMHSHDYKRPEIFDDKRVLVIGIGNSATDIAVDVSRTAKQVHVSTRRGAWVISRMGPFGIPADALANSRCSFSLPTVVLQHVVQAMAEYRFSHENYGVKPLHTTFQAHPTINDEFPHRIMVGAVKVRPDIQHFTGNAVHFTDGTSDEIDAVIMATGYDYKFSFLDESIVDTTENRVSLYKYVFPPHLEHSSLGMIGLVQAIGAVIPISEMQARWYTRVIKGLCTLPSDEDMRAAIDAKRQVMDQQYLPSRRHHLQTFWIQYMDEIAEEIGVKPQIGKMLKDDPMLALRCFFTACIPAQYRLQGPGTWHGARAAIYRSYANNTEATRTRVVKKASHGNAVLTLFRPDFLAALAMFLVAVFLYYIG